MSEAASRLTSEMEARSKELYEDRPRPLFTTGKDGPHSDLASLYLDSLQSALDREHIRDDVNGSILFTIAIRPDGSVKSIRIHKNTGGPPLESALHKGIALAAPFKPFPEGLDKEFSEINITRTIAFWSERRGKYEVALLSAIDSIWDHAGATSGVRCEATISQSLGGTVVDVAFGDCPYEAQSRSSIEQSVKATTLPYQGFEDVFMPKFRVTFCYPREQCHQPLGK